MTQIIHSLSNNIQNQSLILGANPAAATDFSYLVPAYRQVELVAANFTLTTDANAADRYVSILITKAGQSKVKALTAIAHTASKAIRYSFAYTGAGVIDMSAAGQIQVPLFRRFRALPGDTINIIASAKQVGDQFSSIFLTVNSWITEQTA